MLLLLLLLAPGAARAQVRFEIKLRRSTFVPYEPVEVILAITNLAGRDLVFENGAGGRQWLDVELTSAANQAAAARGEESGVPLQPVDNDWHLPALSVPAGATVKRVFDIGPHFSLREPGGYRLKANLYFADADHYFSSNAVAFDLTEGRTIWQQTVGVPAGRGGDAPGGSGLRQYTLLAHRLPDRMLLYVRVRDVKAGVTYTTQSLGRIMTGGEEPRVALDRANHLHVLHLAAPRTYVYSEFSLNGERVARQVFTKDSKAVPNLVATPAGEVVVRNATPQAPSSVAANAAPADGNAVESGAPEGDLPVRDTSRSLPGAPRLSERPAGLPTPAR
ncbi:MAG: hypothetical protein JO295_13050 [Verrucomicrobia bacterium]|nr:hypothetical protein [Verrucomicrobiota bacterium]